MYGLVNKGIEDMALAAGGEDTWRRIKAEAGVDAVAFVSMDAYPDAWEAEILESFGLHWVLYTAREGYGPLLNSAGTSMAEFLENLDALHVRVGLTSWAGRRS